MWCQPRGQCASVDDVHGASSECKPLIYCSHNSHSLSILLCRSSSRVDHGDSIALQLFMLSCSNKATWRTTFSVIWSTCSGGSMMMQSLSPCSLKLWTSTLVSRGSMNRSQLMVIRKHLVVHGNWSMILSDSVFIFVGRHSVQGMIVGWWLHIETQINSDPLTKLLKHPLGNPLLGINDSSNNVIRFCEFLLLKSKEQLPLAYPSCLCGNQALSLHSVSVPMNLSSTVKWGHVERWYCDVSKLEGKS